MYLLSLYYNNAKKNSTGIFEIPHEKGEIPKWILVPAPNPGLEMLRLMGLAACGSRFINHLPFDLNNLQRNIEKPLLLELLFVPHPPTYHKYPTKVMAGMSLSIKANPGWGNQEICPIPAMQMHPIFQNIPHKSIGFTRSINSFVAMGYGKKLRPHHGTDDFNFNDPFHRATRFHSLFNVNAPVTDPVAFLKMLHQKTIRFARLRGKKTLPRLLELFRRYFDIDTGSWLHKDCDLAEKWPLFGPWLDPALLVIDSVRHLMEASPQDPFLLNRPGLMIIHRPDLLCGAMPVSRLLMLLDELFPNFQFILSLPEKTGAVFPESLAAQRLILPLPKSPKSRKQPVKLPPKTILLVQVDGRLPNLALMKLSRYHKEKGRSVVLIKNEGYFPKVERIFASCIFLSPASQSKLNRLKKYYGSNLIAGGSGVDIVKRLPPEIEEMPADYSIYPEIKDTAIGFITRGCPFNCSFCLVPRKEGLPHMDCDLKAVLSGRNKLILLDDNILSHPDADEILMEMAVRKIAVNFTQTLDLRLLNRKKANIIRRICCSNLKFNRIVYHFSLNSCQCLDKIRKKYDLFNFKPSENIEFIFMYGFNTTLYADIKRFQFLKTLPGAYVFVQQYQPILGGPEPEMDNFFKDDKYETDKQINALIAINYSQNMKSMEKYFQWLSKLYIRRFGSLHMGLVDTIFRYNKRDKRGLYIATMGGTVPANKIL